MYFLPGSYAAECVHAPAQSLVMEQVAVVSWAMAVLPACGVGLFWSLLAEGVKLKNGCRHLKRDSDGLLGLKSQIPSPRSLHAAVLYSGGTLLGTSDLNWKKIQGTYSYSCTEKVYYIIMLLRHRDWPPTAADEAPCIKMGICFCCPESWKSSWCLGETRMLLIAEGFSSFLTRG